MGAGEAMEGMGRILQILMFVVNIIIWIGSILLFVFGGLSIGGNPYLDTIFGGTLLKAGAIILIIVGVVAFVISFLGCFGALKENKCMLLTYFIIVLILFILLVIGGILGLVFKDKASETLKKGMFESMHRYRIDSDNIATTDWDDAQTEMKCCGVDSRADWRNERVEGFPFSIKYPKSCCRPEPNKNQLYNCQNTVSTVQIWDRGCFQVAMDYAKAHARDIGGAGIGISLIMILGMVCSLMLYMMIGKGSQTVE